MFNVILNKCLKNLDFEVSDECIGLYFIMPRMFICIGYHIYAVYIFINFMEY